MKQTTGNVPIERIIWILFENSSFPIQKMESRFTITFSPVNHFSVSEGGVSFVEFWRLLSRTCLHVSSTSFIFSVGSPTGLGSAHTSDHLCTSTEP